MSTESAEDVRARLSLERALRRVATLAARGADPQQLFSAVAEGDSADILGLFVISLLAFDAQRNLMTKVAESRTPRSVAQIGAAFAPSTYPVTDLVLRTGQPARAFARPIADSRPGTTTESIGAPVVVDGSVWGLVVGQARVADEALPVDCEDWLAEFAGLMATAIENARRRDEVRELAETQGALRRVATLVAQNGEPEAVFRAVAEESARILGVGAVSIIRYDALTGLVTKIYGTHGARSAVPDGTSWPLDECPEGALALHVGGPVRIDDWTVVPGPVAARHVAGGFGQAVAAPVMLDGVFWGHVAGFGEAGETLPTGAEQKLADFTRLMATAIANAEAREELRGLAAEHGAALRRVATLVGRLALPTTVFTAVAREVSRALKVAWVEVVRCRPDGTTTPLGSTAPNPVSTRDAGEAVRRTIEAVRTSQLPHRVPAPLSTPSRPRGSVLGAPIVVNGAVWGAIVAQSEVEPADDAEVRLADFTHLLAGLIVNVQARDDLIASRARIVAAGDEARRRIERNLHDGIQQRVVALALNLRAVRVRQQLPSEVGEVVDEIGRDLDSVLEEIQTFSHGLHPALLTRYGLAPSIRALARRAPFVVDLDLLDERLPEAVETGIYYVISEALANTTKHARASTVSITLARTDFGIRAEIADDGIGGATAGTGSGLIGLADRVESLGGRLNLHSPPLGGTRVMAEIPLTIAESLEIPVL